jgi:diguanylate cyclase (GGDEF)-like protein
MGSMAPVSDAALDERLERVTRFARRMFQVPVVWISLLQGRDLRVRQVQGLPASILGGSLPPDALVRASGQAIVVSDLCDDARYATCRFAVGNRQARAFASCPIHGPGRELVGMVSIADFTPRAWGENDLHLLREVAALAETDVLVTALGESRLQLLATADALRSCALVDPLTQLWNRTATVELLEREFERCRRYEEPFALVAASVDGLDALRTNEGVGTDLAIVEVANRLRGCVRGSDIVGRLDDEQFLMFLGRCGAPAARILVDRMRDQFANRPVNIAGRALQVTLSYGVAGTSEPRRGSMQELIDEALMALAEAARAGGGEARFRLDDPPEPQSASV